jgi:signal transduction histidine kinase
VNNEINRSSLETITVMSDFIRGLQHELGNLTTILNSDVSQVELSIATGTFRPQSLDDLKSDLSDLVLLLNRLKEYPSPQLHIDKVNVIHVLMDTLDTIERRKSNFLTSAQMTFPVIFRPQFSSESLWVTGDEIGLHRAFLNIIVNAIQANQEAGRSTVEIKVGCQEQHALIIIADQGPGIATERLESIFQPSFTTRHTGGSLRGLGLGLFSARAVIQLHRGSLTLENRSGKIGSQAVITLPLIPPLDLDE